MIKKNTFTVKYEKYELENGLQVILHKDNTTHTVAVATLYHVGSAREKIGKTGFAHLFEHLMFQKSENLQPNDFFNKINNLGGSFNGGTWEDGTIYYEIVPNDALETILWMESDRMGFFINTISQQGLDREKDIVINEKRQVMDNQPYGYSNALMKKYLYPKGHPYHSTVIGEVKDIRSTTLKDVKEFYNKFYTPSNATLVICGDINIKKTKELVEKYYGEIKGQNVKQISKSNNFSVNIEENKHVYHEDKFINMPEFTISFPGVKLYSKDAYALDILCDLIGDGKSSALFQEIVIKEKLAPNISIYNNLREHSGEIIISAKTFPDINLQKIFETTLKVLNEFDINNIKEADIQRIKNLAESRYYDGLSSNLNKAINFAQTNVFGGSPEMIKQELDMILSVTIKDLIEVYQKYIKDKKYLTTSIIPIGKTNLVIKDSIKADVDEDFNDESIFTKNKDKYKEETIIKTPSKINRSVEPKLSKLHLLKLPTVWEENTRHGLGIKGIEDHRLPVTYFSIIIKAGTINDPLNKSGVANLTTRLLRESTANKTREQLEDAIKYLGANLVFVARKEWCILSGKCLSRNIKKLLAIAEEILTQPKWDNDDFERIKKDILSDLEQDELNPEKIAFNYFYKTLYGDNPIALPNEGTLDDVKNIELSDLQDYYSKYFSPTISDFIISGDIKYNDITTFINSIEHTWKPLEILFDQQRSSNTENHEPISFINNTNAEQSIIYFGQKAMNRKNEDYIPAKLVNYKLGTGPSSDLFRILRLEHGYTYGIYTDFAANKSFGTFLGSSSVESSITNDAIRLIKETIKNYPKNYTKDDLEQSKNAILRKLNSNYDTLKSYHSFLTEIATMDLAYNYVEEEMNTIKNLSYKNAMELIQKYLNIDDMKFLVLCNGSII